MPIEPGLISELRHVVVEADTAASYASGLVPTLSTPHLIALMENAARAAVEPGLLSEQSTVGVRVDMQHLAPTPVGMEVRVQRGWSRSRGGDCAFTSMPGMRWRKLERVSMSDS
jgi:predicted thioesterase